ncbi:hypothetical protein [Methanobrevibacter sp.]|uniref:hypothetical protein n=1 Tax=Methanobrevibacter sp. TaxID=66852 RepID=UPI00387031CC
MPKKKLIMLAILALCLLSISTATAADIGLDNNTNDEIACINDEIDMEENEISDDAPEILSADDKSEESVLSDSPTTATVIINGKEYPAEIINGTASVNTQSNETTTILINGKEYTANIINGTAYLNAPQNTTEPANVTNQNAKPAKIPTIIEATATFTRTANDYPAGERGEYFYATLKDANGNALANKTCYIAVNGPIYTATTDKDGKFGIPVNLAAANTYTYALTFLGDDHYQASFASTKLILKAKKTSITAKAKTFKAKAKTKSISVTLKTVKNQHNGKTYLKAGKKITLKIKGKKYTAKTNAKGVAKFNIKLAKKGKYTAKFSFAGDKTYNASTKSIKITIK